MNKEEHYYCLVEQGNTWVEDFIDEDTNEIVSIEQFAVECVILTIVTLPLCKDKKYQFDYINSYIRGNSKYYRLKKLLTIKKFNRIDNGEVKKYKGIKYKNLMI